MDKAFQQGMAAAMSVAGAVMGETVKVKTTELQDAVVLDGGSSSELNGTIGGRTLLVSFTVHLSPEHLKMIQPLKGSAVWRQKTNETGRIQSITRLAGGGVALTCGPLQTVDV